MDKTISPLLVCSLSAFVSPLLLWAAFVGTSAWAVNSELDAEPRVIPYQGHLDLHGSPFTGDVDMEFTLEGDEGCFYVEQHEDVQITSGRYAVGLGAVMGNLSPCLFDSQRVFLSMGVRAGSSEGAFTMLAGRQRIHPVPFAYWAAERSDLKVEGALTTTGNHATIGAPLNTADLQSAPALELGGLVSGATNPGAFSEFQLLAHRGATPTTSAGVGQKDALGVFFQSPTGFQLYSQGDTNLMSIQRSGSALATGLDVGGALTNDGLTVNGQASLQGALTVTGNTTITGDMSVGTTINIGNNNPFTITDIYTAEGEPFRGGDGENIQILPATEGDGVICFLLEIDGYCSTNVWQGHHRVSAAPQSKCSARCLVPR